MQRSLFLAASGVLGIVGVLGMACGDAAPTDTPDASLDASVEATTADVRSENLLPPPGDASKRQCTLDNGDDPVLLCTQKLILKAVHDAVFVANTGVLTSWDATSFAPDTNGSGGYAHDVHDDAAFARACATYGASATHYGDTELTQTLDLDLVALVPIIKAQLATLPDEYAGDLYADLRGAATGLRILSRNDDAAAFDALGDAIGKAILAHFVSLSGTSLDGGVSDAGGGGFDAGDAGDAGTLPQGDGVLASDATKKDYAPDQVATGALALLDMAVRHTTDDPANALRYVSAAQQSFDHLYLRGRDPKTLLYYRLLTPSAAAGADDLSPRAGVPADLLATATTGGVALALLRANDLVLANLKSGGPIRLVANYPFADRGNEALKALNGKPSLYDTDKGYMEGYVPSTGTLLTNKPTRANTLVFTAIHRANVVGVSPYGPQLKLLRSVLSARAPLGAGLLTASPGQTAFYASVAQDFSVPPASYTIGDAGNVGPFVAHPNSYVTSAVTSVVDAFEEEWNGYP